MGIAPFTAFYQFIPDNVCSQLQNDLFSCLLKDIGLIRMLHGTGYLFLVFGLWFEVVAALWNYRPRLKF